MRVRKVIVVTVVMLGVAAAVWGTTMKSLYKVSRLSQTDVAIGCLNGGDPTGRMYGDVLIISCGSR